MNKNIFFLLIGPFTENYDFRLENSLYKILKDKMNMTAALQACQNELEGGGWVLSIESEAEIVDIGSELLIRHEGTELEYWVFGNITDNFIHSQISTPPQSGKVKTTFNMYNSYYIT